MATFAENLQHLPKVDDVERIELTDAQGMPAGIIENNIDRLLLLEFTGNHYTGRIVRRPV